MNQEINILGKVRSAVCALLALSVVACGGGSSGDSGSSEPPATAQVSLSGVAVNQRPILSTCQRPIVSS